MSKNKKKLNKSIVISILFLVFFVSIGSSILYRARITENKLSTIYGKIEKLEIKKVFNPFRKRDAKNYSILFHLKGKQNIYGIYSGTKNQTLKKKTNMNLKLLEEYIFLIDNSVQNSFNNINLGVKIIKKKNKVVFKENNKAEIFFGRIFIIMGIISSSILYYIAKRKFS